jgi:hypothetical protein
MASSSAIPSFSISRTGYRGLAGVGSGCLAPTSIAMRNSSRDECSHFQDVLAETPGAFVEPFMSAPSPGILAMAVRNEYYDTFESYLAALGAALRIEYEAIVKHGFLL